MENLSAPLSQETKTVLIDAQNKKDNKRVKYNFLEIMVVISAVGVVVVLALLAINPGKQGAEARNLQRQADISNILSIVSTYTRENNKIPYMINITDETVTFGNEICKSGPYDCLDFTDLNPLNDTDSNELVDIPTDPMYISVNGTGYFINQDGDGGVTVAAPYAERNKEISFTKYLY